MGNRRLSREMALQALYFLDQSKCPVEEGLVNFWRKEEKEHDPQIRDFCEHLVRGVMRHLDELDDEINRFSHRWKVDRMNIVDRSLLRLSAFELKYSPDVPAAVSINEAVDMGRRFGDEHSAAFINGILHSLALDAGHTMSKKE